MAGVKDGGAERLDVALVASSAPCRAAGVFTTNQVIAAPCVITKQHLSRGPLRAIVANSGNANACTGAQGECDALAMASAAAASLGVPTHAVAVASTGVIGVPLPAERIAAAVPRIELSVGGWDAASRAIMTTDTRPKVAQREVALEGGTIRVGGIAKGAGMIHPNMATLLAFITTDALVDGGELQALLRRAADATFNTISVDGDMSTNDTLLLLANGTSGVSAGVRDRATFADAVTAVCDELARAIVADGEGVTRVFAVHVKGAATQADASLAARVITTSSLVKTAIHGGDPNWGRILAAAGRSGARVDARVASVQVGGIPVYANGEPCAIADSAVRTAFASSPVEIGLDLGLGEGESRAWGADLSAEYVRINADYTT